MGKAKTAPKRVNAEYLDRDPSEVHTGLSEYIEETTGRAISAGDVALVQRLYPVYLKSDDVRKARERAEAERQAEIERKAAEKRERAQRKLDRLNEERAKLLAELGVDEEATVTALRVVSEDKPIEAADEPDDEVIGEIVEDDEAIETEMISVDTSDADEAWDEDEEDEEDF